MDALQEFFLRDQYARLSHITLIEVRPGFARAQMPLQPCHLNGVGIAHGGALFTLADFAFAVASNSHGTVAVAINASINILKATKTGTLTAEAREITRSHRLGHYTVEVKDETGALVALFQGMVYRKDEALPL